MDTRFLLCSTDFESLWLPLVSHRREISLLDHEFRLWLNLVLFMLALFEIALFKLAFYKSIGWKIALIIVDLCIDQLEVFVYAWVLYNWCDDIVLHFRHFDAFELWSSCYFSRCHNVLSHRLVQWHWQIDVLFDLLGKINVSLLAKVWALLVDVKLSRLATRWSLLDVFLRDHLDFDSLFAWWLVVGWREVTSSTFLAWFRPRPLLRDRLSLDRVSAVLLMLDDLDVVLLRCNLWLLYFFVLVVEMAWASNLLWCVLIKELINRQVPTTDFDEYFVALHFKLDSSLTKRIHTCRLTHEENLARSLLLSLWIIEVLRQLFIDVVILYWYVKRYARFERFDLFLQLAYCIN